MTGFGRSTAKGPLTVEVLSVNRKYLEVAVFLPKELSHCEYEVRKWVGEKVLRGQVTVRVQWTLGAEPRLPDVKMLQKLKQGWERVTDALGMDEGQITLPFLLQVAPEKNEVDEKTASSLQKHLGEALKALVQMKKKEGEAIEKDLAKRLKSVENAAGEIEKLAPEGVKKMREKLMGKMKDLLISEIEERVYREVALFAEKVDITEELVRLHSHVGQFRQLLKGAGGGRKMEFLMQEMGREVNTIGSKSMEAKISHLVVEIKSELEKMREQIQNVE